uniref:Family with sequence similarity 111 member A n=1 Tax=Latimeria chalumnae TaxID=7897 RepID=H3A2F6_LATCH
SKEKASNSRDPLRDLGNGKNKESDHPKVRRESSKQEDDLQDKIEFRVSFQKESKEHVMMGKPNQTLLSVVISYKVVKDKMKNRKGISLIGKRNFNGYANLGTLCKCLPANGLFELVFHNEEQMYRSLDETSPEKKSVLFHVDTSGRRSGRAGTSLAKIVRSTMLKESRNKFCVFAFEDETIYEALCKDGRFLPILQNRRWKLVENGITYYENKLPVSNISNKTFEVEVSNEMETGQQEATKPEGNETVFQCPEDDLLTEYQSSLIKKNKEQFSEFLAVKGKGKKEISTMKIFKECFGKKICERIPARLHEILAERKKSVGYLVWDNNERKGSASCFHLAKGYILTCYHVILDIVGEGVEKAHWPAVIHHSTRVNFHYDNENEIPDDKWLPIALWDLIAGKELDYVVLKLETDPLNFPPELISKEYLPPFNGLVYIIGHPEGHEKSTDFCSIITYMCREEEVTRRLSDGQREGCTHTSCGYKAPDENCIHLMSRQHFNEVLSSDVLTYDTSFFQGSSGSPVFDSKGHPVALHAAGYLYQHYGNKQSLIEFGPTFKAIL